LEQVSRNDAEINEQLLAQPIRSLMYLCKSLCWKIIFIKFVVAVRVQQ